MYYFIKDKFNLAIHFIHLSIGIVDFKIGNISNIKKHLKYNWFIDRCNWIEAIFNKNIQILTITTSHKYFQYDIY